MPLDRVPGQPFDAFGGPGKSVCSKEEENLWRAWNGG